MSPSENKALVRAVMEARARGEHNAFLDLMTDDFVWRITGSSDWSGDYVGKEDVKARLLRPLYEQFVTPTLITPSRILADEDCVVVECGGDTTTKAGERYANTYCLVIRMAEGRFCEMTEYMDTALVQRVLQPPPHHR